MNTTHLPQFPDFKPVEIKDRDFMVSMINEYQMESCEYSFANLFCWQRTYDIVWSMYQGRIVIFIKKDQSFLMPVGECLAPEELFVLSAFIRDQTRPPTISSVPEAYFLVYPEIRGYYAISEEREHADYLYSVDKLVDLKGKKLQKKKNLIAQFKRTHPNYRIREIQEDSIAACRAFAASEFDSRAGKDGGVPDTLMEENQALNRALDYFTPLGLSGLVLTVNGSPAAFSLFSRLNPSTFDIHFEKSDLTIKGAAQMINHETAKFLKDKCTFINREQDLGIPGLRRAKLSYDPDDILMHATLAVHTAGSTR